MLYKSPAKLNLFLKVLYKRADHYHEMASFFQAIDFYDEIKIVRSFQDSFICHHPELKNDPSNLIIKARNLFREITKENFPIAITLKKNIPMGAGLGGGSSNAATVLFGLNQLAKKKLTEKKLQYLSLRLGSDLPFFFSKGSAYCTGRGEKVKDYPFLKKYSYFLYKPNFSLATARIYQNLDLNTLSCYCPKELLEAHLAEKTILVNDLEKAAFTLEPELFFFKRTVEEKIKVPLLMTGSGSVFFTTQNPLVKPAEFLVQASSLERKLGGWY